MIAAADVPYQSCYCEENVYKMFEQCEDRDGLYAVLVSNDPKTVMLWCQKSAPTPDGAVVWDYHVFAIRKSGNQVKVYDKDSTLDWGVDFTHFWTETMKPIPPKHAERFGREFRVIPANIYLSLLSSDRTHMKNKDGEFVKPPPEWPLINPHLPSNLMQLLSFKEHFQETTIMNEQQMIDFFSV